MASPQKFRRLVLTASVVSITIAGTLYGAGIKTDQEIAQNTRKRQEATFDEKMAGLQGLRSDLTARKGMIETQIRDLDNRIHEKKQRSAAGSDKGNSQESR